MSKPIRARALVFLYGHAVAAGAVIEAEASTIKALADQGQVDPHKDAVAAALQDGQPVTRSAIEVAAEGRARQADALRVELSQLQDLHDKSEDAATKTALVAEIATKTSELTALAYLG